MSAKKDRLAYLDRVTSSLPAVWRVSMWLTFRGNDVQLPSFEFYEDDPTYADQGDFFLVKPAGLLRCEVKHIKPDFTSMEDWPFEKHLPPLDRPFIVDGCGAYDKKLTGGLKPWAYFIVSASMSHVAWLYCSTKDAEGTKWRRETRSHSLYQSDKLYYIAPMSVVTFEPIIAERPAAKPVPVAATQG